MDDIKWGINPPRFAGSQVYYRDIVVFAVQKNQVIGAEKFDLDGNSEPFSTIDITYNPRLKTEFTSIQHPGDDVMDSIIRTTWLFNSKEEAFLQKVIMLDYIKDYFHKKQIEDKKYFDTKIRPDIKEKLENLKSKYPEFML